MSGFIKKQYDIDQETQFVLVSAGPSIALGVSATGKDILSESPVFQVTSGKFPSPTETLSETPMVTVV